MALRGSISYSEVSYSSGGLLDDCILFNKNEVCAGHRSQIRYECEREPREPGVAKASGSAEKNEH